MMETFQFDGRGVTKALCVIKWQVNRGKGHVYGFEKFVPLLLELIAGSKEVFFKIENFKYVWRHRGKTVYKGRT